MNQDRYKAAQNIPQTSNSYNSAASLDRSSESVTEQTANLATSIDQLELALSDFVQKIKPVLLSVPPSPERSGHPEPLMCEVSTRLAALRNKVETMTTDLRQISTAVSL